ncbi:MAG: hypothetical protein JWP12_888 [Bacteroidetes bacterium]|nr:hypothetical protein [Bacteroidota bacterium]
MYFIRFVSMITTGKASIIDIKQVTKRNPE